MATQSIFIAPKYGTNLGNYDKAIDDFTVAINHSRQKSMHHYGERACSYAKQGNYKKAIDDFTKAMSLDPKNASYYRNRAWCYGRLGFI